MLTASKSNSISLLKGDRNTTTTSISIPKSCKDDYKILREFLTQNNISLGTYLVESFRLNYKQEFLNSKLENSD